jgi:exosortase C (VPDSG-CTERM-specific)
VEGLIGRSLIVVMETGSKMATGDRDEGRGVSTRAQRSVGPQQGRWVGIGPFMVYAIAIVALFLPTLRSWAVAAWSHEHNSHVLLIPIICGYLTVLSRDRLPKAYQNTPIVGGVLLLVSLAVLATSWSGSVTSLDRSDLVSLQTAAFVMGILAGGYFFLGKEWMRAQAFPAVFLFFMIPLPDRVANALEVASQMASAEATAMFFAIGGVPHLREGNVFQIPGIVLQVAQECSGIRSSLVLFITGLLAANLFLRSTWRRVLLVAFVIPLGILRNGFRILVLGLLCVHVGPHMIDSVIHHQGGPLFFALSLIPLLLFLLLLRKGDSRSQGRDLLPAEAAQPV